MSSEPERRVEDKSVAALLAETVLTSSQTQFKIDSLSANLNRHIAEEEKNKNEYLEGFDRRSPIGHIESHRALEGYVKTQAFTNTIIATLLLIIVGFLVLDLYLHFLKP